ETGTDNPQQRLAAALLASVHRVLAAEASVRSLAGQPREEICAVLADAATRAFDLLEPSLGSYGVRAGHGEQHPYQEGPSGAPEEPPALSGARIDRSGQRRPSLRSPPAPGWYVRL